MDDISLPEGSVDDHGQARTAELSDFQGERTPESHMNSSLREPLRSHLAEEVEKDITAALNAGLPVFVEKPMAGGAEAARRMREGA